MTSQEALDLVNAANRGTVWPATVYGAVEMTLQEFIDWTIGPMRAFLVGTRTRISSMHAIGPPNELGPEPTENWELVPPPRRRSLFAWAETGFAAFGPIAANQTPVCLTPTE